MRKYGGEQAVATHKGPRQDPLLRLADPKGPPDAKLGLDGLIEGARGV